MFNEILEKILFELSQNRKNQITLEKQLDKLLSIDSNQMDISLIMSFIPRTDDESSTCNEAIDYIARQVVNNKQWAFLLLIHRSDNSRVQNHIDKLIKEGFMVNDFKQALINGNHKKLISELLLLKNPLAVSLRNQKLI